MWGGTKINRRSPLNHGEAEPLHFRRPFGKSGEGTNLFTFPGPAWHAPRNDATVMVIPEVVAPFITRWRNSMPVAPKTSTVRPPLTSAVARHVYGPDIAHSFA